MGMPRRTDILAAQRMDLTLQGPSLKYHACQNLTQATVA